MMKILHVYKDYHPILGGIENHIKLLAEGQAAAGHRVTVLVSNPGGQPRREQINGVEVVRAPRLATLASTPLTLGFLPYLARSKPDITHLHFPYPVGELSQQIAGRRRPFVITYHSDITRTSQKIFLAGYRPLLRRVLDAADCILATSQNYLESSPYLRPVAQKCVLVPLGVDPHAYDIPVDSRHQETPGGGVILFFGRHRYYKGVEDLIQAMRWVGADLLVGGDGEMRTAWESLAERLGLDGRVRFLGDVPSAQVPALFAQADVFVLPSTLRSEAFGTVLLEAMAAGLPCVTTELGTGTSFVVQDGVTGRVVPPRDPRALADALNQLLADGELRRRMGAAGRDRVRREFTLDQMRLRVEAVYQDVLSRSSLPGR